MQFQVKLQRSAEITNLELRGTPFVVSLLLNRLFPLFLAVLLVTGSAAPILSYFIIGKHHSNFPTVTFPKAL